MKKLLVIVIVISLVALGTVIAFADETDSNLTSEAYLALRLEQIDQLLEDGVIDEAQAALLREHVTENAANGLFGRRGEGSETCVLGEEFQGIFRNNDTGHGFGSGMMLQDGSGYQRGGRGNGGGHGGGLRDGSCLTE